MITGKCKEDFIKYLFESVGRGIRLYPYKVFRELEPSMQFGVLVDFFESKDLCIEICKMHLSKYYYWMIDDGCEENTFNTRNDARIAAIKRANEIYNLTTA